MKTVFRGFHFIMIMVLLSSLIGCTSQGKVKEEVEKLVISAEKLSNNLKNEIDYTKRLQTHKDKAFTTPDKNIYKRAEKSYKVAKATVKDIKDKKIKAKFDKRLKKVNTILEDASAIAKALEKGKELNKEEIAFRTFITENPLSAEMEVKVTEFERLLADKDAIKKDLPTAWQNDYAVNVMGDGTALLQSAKNILTTRGEIAVLTDLITKKASKKDIETQLSVVNTAVASVTIETVRTTLETEQATVVKPYTERLAEEQRLAQAQAEATKTKTTIKTSTSTKTTTGTKSTTSTSGGTTTNPSTQTGDTTRDEGVKGDMYYKYKPICDRYGLFTYGLSNGTATCISSSGDVVTQGGAGMLGGLKGYPLIVADIAYVLGVPVTQSEIREFMELADSKVQIGDFADGKVKISYGNQWLLVVEW